MRTLHLQVSAKMTVNLLDLMYLAPVQDIIYAICI